MTTNAKLDSLELDPRLQRRVSMDADHIDTMAEHLADPDFDLPAVFAVKGERLWVWDGFHRIAAYRKAGRKEIPVLIQNGNFDKAFDLSLGANATHGKARTKGDIEYVLKAAFEHRGERSDRDIGKLTGIGHVTVSKYRKILTVHPRTVTEYTTKHGTPATMNVANIGKAQPKPDPVPGWDDEPEGIQPDPPPSNRLPDLPAKPQPTSNGTHHTNGVLRVGDKPRPNPDADDLPTMPKVEPMDSLGNPVPKNLRDTFAGNTQALENSIRLLQEVRRTAKGLEAWNAWMRPAEMESKLDELIEDFKNGLPYAVCDDCKGKGCTRCRKEGWLTKWAHEEMSHA
jgi:hypothetical protein